ncbi:hypothetical membrane protein [Staphylococcus lugdunensis N920143]|nr:hypothetical membrane protein [Staphylococcus lugdunensis N920143]
MPVISYLMSIVFYLCLACVVSIPSMILGIKKHNERKKNN